MVSLSVGVASCQLHLTDQGKDQDQTPSTPVDIAAKGGFHLARELFDRADQALYAAKTAGRDQVCLG